MLELMQTYRSGEKRASFIRINPQHENRCNRISTIFTKIALWGLATTSLAEAIGFSVLTWASYPFIPISSKPKNLFNKLAESGAFSVLWGAYSAMKCNVIIPRECLARACMAMVFAQVLNKDFHEFLRPEDKQELLMLQQDLPQVFAPPMEQAHGVNFHNNVVQEGADFLVQQILKDASPAALADFHADDPRLYHFVAAKSVFSFVFGTCKDKPIPAFFKPETQNFIKDCRLALHNKDVVNALEKIMQSPDQFDLGTNSAPVKVVLNDIKSAAFKELNGGLLSTDCWLRARQILSK